MPSFAGYFTGAEDYYTHANGKKCKGLDLTLCHGSNITAQLHAVGTYSTQVFGDRIAEIVTEHNLSQPLFLYLPFQSVHEPLQAPASYVAKYANVKTSADRKTFMGMVSALDDACGAVVAKLQAKGLWNDTCVRLTLWTSHSASSGRLLIFTTDNGGNL